MIALVVTALLSVGTTALYVALARRRRVLDLAVDLACLPPVDEAIPLLAGLTRGTVLAGNAVELYDNGELLRALFEAVERAEHTIHFETFVWRRGAVEREFVARLCRKAQAGVKVRLILDALGGFWADPRQLHKLRRAGVEVNRYCKARWWNWRRFNHRTHRKLLIVDGRLAFTFGHGIGDRWRGNAEDRRHWRDVGVSLRGPAVAALQAVFIENWVLETQTVPLERSCFPPLQPAGPVVAHVVSSAMGDAVSSVGLLYTLAIACARRTVHIQNPYFAPERGLVRLLAQVVARGVEVHLMVPGRYTDSPFVRRAGCALYGDLLAAGVRIYEFQPTLLHQKIVVVDGLWCHVGSTNFDARALALNAEVGVGLLDPALAERLLAGFRRDLERSREITPAHWRKRRWHARAVDRFAYLLRDQL